MTSIWTHLRQVFRSIRQRVRRRFCRHEQMTDSRRFDRKATCLRCGYREPW